MVPPEVESLIERFVRNRESYEAATYNETQLRREFLDPVLKALGWDVENASGYAEAYKDVVHEDAIRIEGSPKAPDYSLRVGGVRKFFVEAKKPSMHIATDPAGAYQLRRYAWSAGLPLSLLTNFATFAAYDCGAPPDPSDRSVKGRVLLLTVDELAERWDEIADVFGREAVLRGNFDRFSKTAKDRRGTAPVDDYFLREIEQWRQELAADIAIKNRSLTQHQLNAVVQATIDRIIFLRICEDRGLEHYAALRNLAPRAQVYGRLLELFKLADARYNSGLFHFTPEPGRSMPDTLSTELRVDDKLLRSILQRLYYPDSPYQFSVISPEILGQVYERFLGKVIRLSGRRVVNVEDKPEIRRAGGVYYTPAYIVRFIVDHTLGQSLADRSVASLVQGGTKRQRLRIIDPACGSGSFLIVAYQHLLDWYLTQYTADDPERWARGRPPRIYRDVAGRWRLTTAERKRILLDHIYGVDIDSQAVEVTKLSLLLKVLEGESDESLQQVLRVFNERALPDLDANIKCGNSLVAGDVWGAVPGLSEEELSRINPFEWDEEFPDAMGAGGFEVVIGNPPYVYRNATEDLLRGYYAAHYKSTQGNLDLYKFFIERGLKLCREGGRLGYIVSASFLIQPSFARLRELILGSAAVERLAPLGPGAFSKATIDSTILVARCAKPAKGHKVVVQAPGEPTGLLAAEPYTIPQERFANNPGATFDYRLREEGAAIVSRLAQQFPRLDSGFDFGVGINTGYIREALTADEKVDDRYHPMVTGRGISPLGPVRTEDWIMYDPTFVREQGRLGRTLPQERFLKEDKILVVRTRNLALDRRIIATLDGSGGYNLNRLSNIVALKGRSLHGLAGFLNSALFEWLFATRYYDYEIKPVYLRSCPLGNSEDPRLVDAVDRALAVNVSLSEARTPDEARTLERAAVALQRLLDDLVFDLYGITDVERDHIESQLASFAATAEPASTDSYALTLAAHQQQSRITSAVSASPG
jgi:hypothetical protein